MGKAKFFSPCLSIHLSTVASSCMTRLSRSRTTSLSSSYSMDGSRSRSRTLSQGSQGGQMPPSPSQTMEVSCWRGGKKTTNGREWESEWEWERERGKVKTKHKSNAEEQGEWVTYLSLNNYHHSLQAQRSREWGREREMKTTFCTTYKGQFLSSHPPFQLKTEVN